MGRRGIFWILLLIFFLTGCSSDYRFKNPDQYYDLTIEIDGKGTTSPAENFEAEAGGTVYLEAFSESDSEFVEWIGEVNDTYDPETTILMDEDKEVKAVFKSENDFDEGSGTAEDPYRVETAEHLNNTRKYLESHFKQTADIDLSEYDEWNPIGYSGESLSDSDLDEQRDYYFRGNYDGDGNKITGLKIAEEEKSYRGLFGRVYDATIKEVKLKEVDISGDTLSGGLAGLLDHSTVINSQVRGGLVKAEGVAGGLIGGMRLDSFIENSSAEVTVEGIDSAGGLAGYINQHGDEKTAAIKNSYARGEVESTGSLEDDDRYGGGLVGAVNSKGEVINSYATGLVSDSGTDTVKMGGLIGQKAEATTIENSYYDKETSEQDDTGKGEPRTTEEMKSEDSFTDWDFEKIWELDQNNNEGYPYLQSE